MSDRQRPSPRRPVARHLIVGSVALLALLVLVGQSVAIGAGQGELAAVRDATDAVPRPLRPQATPGYGEFYVCTDENTGLGADGPALRQRCPIVLRRRRSTR